jgi:hypothetical protein
MGSFSPTIANNPTTQNMTAPMGGPNGQPEQQFTGKGFAPQQGQQPQAFGKGTTNSATSGQPQMGSPSQNPQSGQMYQPQRNFPNTIQQSDNTGNTTNQPMSAGKGKGA